jgi:hypothetical protein
MGQSAAGGGLVANMEHNEEPAGSESGVWMSFMIGNSRIHWAIHNADGSIVTAWDSTHLVGLGGTSSVHGVPCSAIPTQGLALLENVSSQSLQRI